MSQSRRRFLELSAKSAVAGLAAAFTLPAMPRAWAQHGGHTSPPAPTPTPANTSSALYGLIRPQGPIVLEAMQVPGVFPATGGAMLAYALAQGGTHTLNPSLVLRKGEAFAATLHNSLSEPTIIHWHGVDCPWKQAGHPSYAVGPGEKYAYSFPITNRAGTYWYHPHPHGLTAKQAYLGLASFFIVQDDEDDAFSRELDLALGATDIPLLLQDKRLGHDGSLVYAPTKDDLLMGYLGDTIVANGAVNPVLSVGTRIYRLRLLNGSTARIFNLGFTTEGSAPIGFHVVGNDGGFLPAPQSVTGLFLSPGERADILLDLRAIPLGSSVTLRNLPFDAMHNEMGGHDMGGHGSQPQQPSGHMQGMHGSSAPEAGAHQTGEHGGGLAEGADYPILRLLVERRETYDRRIPSTLPQPPTWQAADGIGRTVSLAMDHMRRWTINGLTYDMAAEPIVVEKRLTERWRIANTQQSMPHPMHLHGYPFRVAAREGSPKQVAARAVDNQGRLPTDLGLKDTVLVWPGETVVVDVDFSTPDYPGPQLFLLHCHNLEHEDQGMMLNVRVR